MSKKKADEGRKLATPQLQMEVLALLASNPKKRYNARQIIEKLGISNTKDAVNFAFGKLAEGRKIVAHQEFKFGIGKAIEVAEPADFPKKQAKKFEKGRFRGAALIEGTVDMTRTGSAYITTDLLDEDVYVGGGNMNGAFHGDTVRVQIYPRRHGRKPEGEVIEIVKRATEHFIGTYRQGRKYGLVVPDRVNMPTDIFVRHEDSRQANDGDRVVVKIIDWQAATRKAPIGEITTVLGKPGSADIEMKTILVNQGFPLEFPPEALEESERIPLGISPQEIGRRRDFRGITTFTIDPEDAKDFDDALSFRKLDDGAVEIGVHIADVTHYLKAESPLDKEAFNRSTSVYLVDRVLPMLPEKLSNNLCSLVPQEDRLTFSAVFVFDEKFKITSRWFGKTVIYSDKRFSYEAAQEVIENKAGDYVDELLLLNEIAHFLRKANQKNGAIGFDSEEVRFKLDENGVPIEAYVKERKEAHLLIEDFMLLANKEVALFIESKSKNVPEIPFVYRIHDLPNMEKVVEFARFAHDMGFPMRIDTPKHLAESFNRLTIAAKKNEALKILEPLAIRTMAKAVYSTENIGHYGLGFSHYSHFTSPIRRYSDVLSHRILERNLGGGQYRMDKEKLEEKCKHVSKMERRAADAERESVKYSQVLFMKTRVGEVFEGVIRGIIERGFFVEVAGSRAEGMVEFASLGDLFLLENGRLKAVGRRFGQTFKMGQKVRVRIVGTDVQKREISMELVEQE